MENYPIAQRLLPVGLNRPGTPLAARGVAIHETATPGATADAEARYFSSGIRGASAHYFVDYAAIVQLIPEDEVAWHAGRTANARYIAIELCHFDQPELFQQIWQRGVWLCADICRRRGFNPDADVVSHAWISATWHETSHTDPVAYFSAHGKTFQDFVNDVKEELSAMQTPSPLPPAAQPTSTGTAPEPQLVPNKTVLYTVALIDGQTAPAVVIDGKSYIGARDLAGLLGYAVAWDAAAKRVVLTKR